LEGGVTPSSEVYEGKCDKMLKMSLASMEGGITTEARYQEQTMGQRHTDRIYS
tara:strand:- start:915 stop:1073 length:159 start_codon:yes stop_codon:yes gene_type:complete